jgi:hypothetical protein
MDPGAPHNSLPHEKPQSSCTFSLFLCQNLVERGGGWCVMLMCLDVKQNNINAILLHQLFFSSLKITRPHLRTSRPHLTLTWDLRVQNHLWTTISQEGSFLSLSPSHCIYHQTNWPLILIQLMCQTPSIVNSMVDYDLQDDAGQMWSTQWQNNCFCYRT